MQPSVLRTQPTRGRAPSGARCRGSRRRLAGVHCFNTDTALPGAASTSGRQEGPRQLGVGNTTVIKKLAGAIAGEITRFGHVTLQATSSQNHLKAMCALAAAQSMAQTKGVAFISALTFESLETTSNTAGKPRRLKTLSVDLREADPFRQLPPPEARVLLAKDYDSEQLLQDAILQALLEEDDRVVVVAARGDTPINRVARIAARLQALFREQGIGDSIQMLPFQLPVPSALPADAADGAEAGKATAVPHVAFAMYRLE